MRKLELNHLAPYLPYGLKCLTSKHQIEYGKQHSLEVRGLSIDDDGELNIEFIHDNDLMFSNRMARVYPELRPMSDLTKEIEHDRERLVPKDWLQMNFPAENIGLNPATWSYRVIQKLLEWHFDVFGLIKEGLAVDLNEVKK